MSRYLVTGATGFLGSHLVNALLERDHEVVALSRTHAEFPSRVSLRLGDILHHDAVADAAAGCDGAFHCAGKVSRDSADAEDLYRVHVEGTKTTLSALQRAGVPRVVIASTSGTIAVSADPNAIADEDTPAPIDLIARWPYYRSKLYAEQAALEMNSDSLEVISINPSLLLGPGDHRDSSTEDVRKFLERKIPFIPAGGAAFVDARDAATAMLLAMDHGRPGSRYLINAANMTLEAFFGRIERISGVKSPPIRLPRTNATLAGVTADLIGRAARTLNLKSPLDRISAEMSQFYWYCDATRARRDLSWSPRDPNDTLSDTIEDLRSRGVVWPS